MIDLNRFAQPQHVIMPIVNGWGKFGGRKISIARGNVPNGWYHMDITYGKLGVRATPLEIQRELKKNNKILTVYAIGEEGIPTSFAAFAHLGFNESVKVHFLNLGLFQVARVVLWDDGRFYFVDRSITFYKPVIDKVRAAYDADASILGIKGITPEIRYLFLLANLQRQSVRAMEELERLNVQQAERERRIKEFQASFSGRLATIVSKAGGTLVNFTKQGENYVVQYKVGGQDLKSIIRDDMRIIDAGFCLSGYDKLHTLSSIIGLAEMYQEDGELNIYRR